MSLFKHKCQPCPIVLFFWMAGVCWLPATQAQTLYKSIGSNGKVIYSNHPPTDAKVTKTLEFKDLPTSRVKNRPQASGPKVSVSDGETILFEAAWCGYCRKAKAYLSGKGISYRDIDIDTPSGRQAFAQVGQGKGIPLLFAHGERIQGYSESAYDALFQ
jgi:glutaredoxin